MARNITSFEYDRRLGHLELFSIKGCLFRADLIKYWKIFHDLSAIQPLDLFVMTPHGGTRVIVIRYREGKGEIMIIQVFQCETHVSLEFPPLIRS